MRLFLLIGCAACAFAQTHENLNAVVWMQTAAEYRANAMQTYRTAEASLLRALKDPQWTAAIEQTGSYAALPPAVVLDLDETVLDNSAFQARLTAAGKPFSADEWAKWEAEQKAGLVPGALEFLTVAHANGVAVVFVTNRVCDASNNDDPTVALLRAAQVPSGQFFCKSAAADPSDKSPRRARVAQRHRILLLIGDDLGDFVTVAPNVMGREAAVNAYRRYWGERWFTLPNPTYGSWERAVGYDVKSKRDALRR
jgi:acid phosphatase